MCLALGFIILNLQKLICIHNDMFLHGHIPWGGKSWGTHPVSSLFPMFLNSLIIFYCSALPLQLAPHFWKCFPACSLYPLPSSSLPISIFPPSGFVSTAQQFISNNNIILLTSFIQSTAFLKGAANLYLVEQNELTDLHKNWTVIQRLSGKALDWAVAVWSDGGPAMESYGAFKHHLQCSIIWGRGNPVATNYCSCDKV